MISTHVLDTESGVPAAGMKIGLFRGKELISLQETDDDGRIADLAEGALDSGEYRLVFYVEGGFFARVDLTISIPDPTAHYHVPLLVSPYACVTYRGS
jgi:5-hydroxyisourate hydrolase